MSNHIGIIHCNNEELTKEIFDILIQKGYAVMQSSQEIETGTNGKHTVKRLDVMHSMRIKPKHSRLTEDVYNEYLKDRFDHLDDKSLVALHKRAIHPDTIRNTEAEIKRRGIQEEGKND